jgi:hypothetical protein
MNIKEYNASEGYSTSINLAVDLQVQLIYNLPFKNQNEYATKYIRPVLLEMSKKRYYWSMGFPMNFCASLTKGKLAISKQGGNINLMRYSDREKTIR